MKAEEIKRLRELLMPELELGPLKIFYTNELRELFEIALDELESNAKSENESEEKSMLHNVTVKHEENKVLEQYWVMRGIKKQYDGLGNEKNVVCRERGISQYPDLKTIAQFLSDSKADFVSVVQNYRFENELPFC